MSGGKIIAYIFSGIIIFFGILLLWGATSDEGSIYWLITGPVTIGIGFVIIWFASRKTTSNNTESNSTNITIDLPGNVNIKKFECQNCGSTLSLDNVKMVAGAPMVDCPYCSAAYQLTEEPKW